MLGRKSDKYIFKADGLKPSCGLQLFVVGELGWGTPMDIFLLEFHIAYSLCGKVPRLSIATVIFVMTSRIC